MLQPFKTVRNPTSTKNNVFMIVYRAKKNVNGNLSLKLL